MVAVDHFGAHGPALGAYRLAQIAIGAAAAGWLIGRIGETVGLRATLLVAVASPLLLVVALHGRRCRRPRSGTAGASATTPCADPYLGGRRSAHQSANRTGSRPDRQMDRRPPRTSDAEGAADGARVGGADDAWPATR